MIPFGPYGLLERLAVGGMAEVFLGLPAPRTPGDELLVVKRILPHLEQRPEFVEMFIDEARIASRLFHDNLVRVFGFGEAEGSHYIAMEYVDGLSLSRLIARLPGRRLDLGLASWLIGQAAQALAYVHSRSDEDGLPLLIVHRDVTPDNILLSRDGAVKLADFGIAKATVQLTHTHPGQRKGKIAYMSPEQANPRRSVDQRSDIFSLGLVLYELTTGRPAFGADSVHELLELVLAARYRPPGELVESYPPALAAVVERALAAQPDHRFQCGEEFYKALEQAAPFPEDAAVRLGAMVDQGSPRRAHPSEQLGRVTVRAPVIADEPPTDVDAPQSTSDEETAVDPEDEPDTAKVPRPIFPTDATLPGYAGRLLIDPGPTVLDVVVDKPTGRGSSTDRVPSPHGAEDATGVEPRLFDSGPLDPAHVDPTDLTEVGASQRLRGCADGAPRPGGREAIQRPPREVSTIRDTPWAGSAAQSEADEPPTDPRVLMGLSIDLQDARAAPAPSAIDSEDESLLPTADGWRMPRSLLLLLLALVLLGGTVALLAVTSLL